MGCYLLPCWDQVSNKEHFRGRKGYFGSWFETEFIIAGKTWC